MAIYKRPSAPTTGTVSWNDDQLPSGDDSYMIRRQNSGPNREAGVDKYYRLGAKGGGKPGLCPPPPSIRRRGRVWPRKKRGG